MSVYIYMWRKGAQDKKEWLICVISDIILKFAAELSISNKEIVPKLLPRASAPKGNTTTGKAPV